MSLSNSFVLWFSKPPAGHQIVPALKSIIENFEMALDFDGAQACFEELPDGVVKLCGRNVTSEAVEQLLSTAQDAQWTVMVHTDFDNAYEFESAAYLEFYDAATNRRRDIPAGRESHSPFIPLDEFLTKSHGWIIEHYAPPAELASVFGAQRA